MSRVLTIQYDSRSLREASDSAEDSCNGSRAITGDGTVDLTCPENTSTITVTEATGAA